VEEGFALQGGKNVKLVFNYRVLPTQMSPKHSVLGYMSDSSWHQIPLRKAFSPWCGRGIREETCSSDHSRLSVCHINKTLWLSPCNALKTNKQKTTIKRNKKVGEIPFFPPVLKKNLKKEKLARGFLWFVTA